MGSASKNARSILEKVNLLSYFQAIVDGNSVTKAKPNPEVFLMAAEQLNVAPQHCVVLEDAVAGIAAANAAQMTSVGIGEAGVLSDADYNFKDFTTMDQAFLDKLVHN